MFIRKRTRKLKNGDTSVTYQAVKSYRQNGKVKQEVVSLGSYSNPKELLDIELKGLKLLQKRLKIPLSEYKQRKIAFGVCIVDVPMTLKQAEKKKNELVAIYEKKKKIIAKLDSVVSKLKIKNT
jgi:hypothetical protein